MSAYQKHQTNHKNSELEVTKWAMPSVAGDACAGTPSHQMFYVFTVDAFNIFKHLVTDLRRQSKSDKKFSRHVKVQKAAASLSSSSPSRTHCEEIT